MIFKENAKRIEAKLQPFIKQLEKQLGNVEFQNYSLIDARTGVSTLQIEQKGKKVFLHSKYNPIQESEKIAKDHENLIVDKEHIIFFGVGLGYHIEKIMSQYPNKSFTLIEPNPIIFVRFMESRSLNKFPFNQMSTLYIGNEEMSFNSFLTLLSLQLKGDTSIVTFPAYERLFEEEVNQFYKDYKEALKETQSNVVTTWAFGKRWVLNSLMNVTTTLTTQNIKEKAKHFKGKPILIASAGPSLYDDLEQLKHIKDKGLAYIFSVGSANKALLTYGITPDAVLTYDPQPHNVNVFKELIASGRTDIPMIYGTSVGFETIEAYPGPKFHLVNSADSVTNFYMNKNRVEFDVQDSKTIALIAIQVAELLGAGSIILTGQNLAFKENRFYAKGIKYGKWEGQVREDKEGEEIHTTTDVFGNLIETNKVLISMRKDIEMHLADRPNLKVINTTKTGAAIKGAPYRPLEEVIENDLTEKVVQEDWVNEDCEKEIINALPQMCKMDCAIDNMYQTIDTCYTLLKRLDGLKRTNKYQMINQLFNEYDKELDKLLKNDFYQIFIQSIIQNEFDQLNKAIRSNYTENDQKKKIDTITSENKTYLLIVQEVFREMIVHVKESLHQKLHETFSGDWKTYKHNDGVFHYEGDWKRETLAFNDFSRSEKVRKINRTISTISKTSESKVSFRFQGTKLQLLATTHADYASKVKIIIDGIERTFTTKNQKEKYDAPPNLQQTVFEIKALPNTIHDVSIELTTDEKFAFQAIQINPDGRMYHVDEVTSIDELEVGKRIRCHLDGEVKEGVAKIIDIGNENSHNMPIHSTDIQEDFYIMKIYESLDRGSKFVCNRNLGLNKVGYMFGNLKHEFTFNVVPIMELDENSIGKALCSTFYTHDNNQWNAYKAFNKQVNGHQNAWATEKGITKGWIEYEFNKPVIINGYTMTSQDFSYDYDSYKRMPKDWILEGFDKENWIQLDRREEIILWETKEKKVFSFENMIAFKRYRVTVYENNGDVNYLAIGEIELI